MLIEQRQAAVLEEINRQGAVRIAEVGRDYGVSDVTARRDLDALAGRGLVARVHGGAMALASSHRASSHRAAAHQAAAHQAAAHPAAAHPAVIGAIGRAAAALAHPGQAVGISAGRTAAAVAVHLLECPALTVVTNSITVAGVFHRDGRADQTVVLVGGVRTAWGALVGPVAQWALAGINLDVLFLGVHGMSVRPGCTSPDFAEADTCQAMLAIARRVVVVADHTKWGRSGVATIAPLSRVDAVVTDGALGAAARTALLEHVGELVVARA